VPIVISSSSHTSPKRRGTNRNSSVWKSVKKTILLFFDHYFVLQKFVKVLFNFLLKCLIFFSIFLGRCQCEGSLKMARIPPRFFFFIFSFLCFCFLVSLLFSLSGFFHPVLEKKIGVGRVEAIRVKQFKEPPEFMSLFGGEILIRSGKRSALRRKILRQYALFRISSTRPGLSHVIQIADQPSPHHLSLFDSNACFVIQSEANVFVWIGARSSRSDLDRGIPFLCFHFSIIFH